MAIVTEPVKLDDDTVKRIEEAIRMDCTIEQICFNANISKQCYYNWIDSFPELKERFDYLRHNLRYKSKQNISNKIEGGDLDTSKWYLERRDKQFKPKQDITSDNKPIPLLGGESNGKNNDCNQKVATNEEEN